MKKFILALMVLATSIGAVIQSQPVFTFLYLIIVLFFIIDYAQRNENDPFFSIQSGVIWSILFLLNLFVLLFMH